MSKEVKIDGKTYEKKTLPDGTITLIPTRERTFDVAFSEEELNLVATAMYIISIYAPMWVDWQSDGEWCQFSDRAGNVAERISRELDSNYAQEESQQSFFKIAKWETLED